MTRKNIHISLIITFTVLFLIFNIGMPIVLHYCEMMNTYSSSDCDMCHSEKNNDGQLEYSKQQHSCCSSLILASFNKTEFLQTQNNAVTQLYNCSITAIPYDSNIYVSATFSNLILIDTHSPPLIKDIPIFTSSLLI
jgi:hypothetical protein